MKFEGKISGTKVTGFEISPIFNEIIYLDEIIKTVDRQETMNWLLDEIRFTKLGSGRWVAFLDLDTTYKLTVLEKYPEYEKEFIEHFGENWMKHYIRFNH